MCWLSLLMAQHGTSSHCLPHQWGLLDGTALFISASRGTNSGVDAQLTWYRKTISSWFEVTVGGNDETSQSPPCSTEGLNAVLGTVPIPQDRLWFI